MAVGNKYFAVMKNELAVSNGVATLGPDGLLNASQRPITDSMPTQGSSNPVQSGGVYSALSNKVNCLNSYTAGDIKQIPKVPGMCFISSAVTGMPRDGLSWLARVDSDGYSRAILDYDGTQQWLRYATDDLWTDWVKIANATPPQEYDLPLAEGWNPYQSSAGNQWACTYSKDQFGIVRLCARLTTQNAIAATGTLIATIPAGFRPLKAFSVVCRVQLPGSGSQILTIADVDMYGQIKLFNVEANANSGTVSLVLPPCSFVAAD